MSAIGHPFQHIYVFPPLIVWPEITRQFYIWTNLYKSKDDANKKNLLALFSAFSLYQTPIPPLSAISGFTILPPPLSANVSHLQANPPPLATYLISDCNNNCAHLNRHNYCKADQQFLVAIKFFFIIRVWCLVIIPNCGKCCMCDKLPIYTGGSVFTECGLQSPGSWYSLGWN